MKDKKIFVFIILSSIILLSGIIYAINNQMEGWRVNAGTTPTIISSEGNVLEVSSTCTDDYFVPANTLAEWTAYNSNLPSCHVLTGTGCNACPMGFSETGYSGDYYKYNQCNILSNQQGRYTGYLGIPAPEAAWAPWKSVSDSVLCSWGQCSGPEGTCSWTDFQWQIKRGTCVSLAGGGCPPPSDLDVKCASRIIQCDGSCAGTIYYSQYLSDCTQRDSNGRPMVGAELKICDGSGHCVKYSPPRIR